MPRVTAALLAVAAATSAAAGSSDPQLAALYTGPVNPQSVCNSGLKPTGWTQTFSLSPAVSGGGLGLSYSATSNVAFAQGDIIVAGGNSPSAYKCNQISMARNMDLALVTQGNVTGKYKQCRSQTGRYKGKFDPSLLCGLCRSTDAQQASTAPQCPIVVVGDSEVGSDEGVPSTFLRIIAARCRHTPSRPLERPNFVHSCRDPPNKPSSN